MSKPNVGKYTVSEIVIVRVFVYIWAFLPFLSWVFYKGLTDIEIFAWWLWFTILFLTTFEYFVSKVIRE